VLVYFVISGPEQVVVSKNQRGGIIRANYGVRIIGSMNGLRLTVVTCFCIQSVFTGSPAKWLTFCASVCLLWARILLVILSGSCGNGQHPRAKAPCRRMGIHLRYFVWKGFGVNGLTPLRIAAPTRYLSDCEKCTERADTQKGLPVHSPPGGSCNPSSLIFDFLPWWTLAQTMSFNPIQK